MMYKYITFLFTIAFIYKMTCICHIWTDDTDKGSKRQPSVSNIHSKIVINTTTLINTEYCSHGSRDNNTQQSKVTHIHIHIELSTGAYN